MKLKKLIPWIIYLIFFAVLNETMFNVSTPMIAKQFSLTPSGVGWMMTIFMIFFRDRLHDLRKAVGHLQPETAHYNRNPYIRHRLDFRFRFAVFLPFGCRKPGNPGYRRIGDSRADFCRRCPVFQHFGARKNFQLNYVDIGFSLFQTVMINSVSQTLPENETGIGMGLFNLVSIISGAVGTALVGKILDAKWLDFRFYRFFQWQKDMLIPT
jgi:hypothetical protein